MATFKIVAREEPQARRYRTDLPVYAYIRFSTLGSFKHSKQSRARQDTGMHQKLLDIGFKEIIKKDKDEAISGQKGLDKRTDLAEIYAAMEKGQCGGIAAFDPARVWRDRDRVHFNDFILRLKEHNVPFITEARTYWPKVREDMEALRAAFEYAQKYLEQAYEVSNPAKQMAVKSGSFGGHAVPAGYVVTGEKGNRKYVIYEPWAKHIRWLFRRYRQLSGNLGRLGRELTMADFHLPDFDNDELRKLGADIPHLSLKRDEKGYKLQSRNALVSILTNRAYLGWYCYEARSEESRVFTGEYINKDAHKAIIELDDFMYAFSRLSKKTLDGEPNEKKPATNRHYSRVQALLEGF